MHPIPSLVATSASMMERPRERRSRWVWGRAHVITFTAYPDTGGHHHLSFTRPVPLSSSPILVATRKKRGPRRLAATPSGVTTSVPPDVCSSIAAPRWWPLLPKSRPPGKALPPRSARRRSTRTAPCRRGSLPARRRRPCSRRASSPPTVEGPSAGRPTRAAPAPPC
jgi:hypothetical protein